MSRCPGHLPQSRRGYKKFFAAIVNGGTEIVSAVRQVGEVEAVELAFVQQFESSRPVFDKPIADRETEIDVCLFLPIKHRGIVVSRNITELRRIGEVEGDGQQVVHEVLLQDDLIFQFEEIPSDRWLRIERKSYTVGIGAKNPVDQFA